MRTNQDMSFEQVPGGAPCSRESARAWATQTGQFGTGASRGLYSLTLYSKPSVHGLRVASDNGDREAPKWSAPRGAGCRPGVILNESSQQNSGVPSPSP